MGEKVGRKKLKKNFEKEEKEINQNG